MVTLRHSLFNSLTTFKSHCVANKKVFSFLVSPAMMELHKKCRNTTYGSNTDVERFPVPDDKVNWDVEWRTYEPPYFTAKGVLGKPWADKEMGVDGFAPRWHIVDGGVDRRSFSGEYTILNGYPLNPKGRTGLRGRGILGKWGPNHAADPIVTRWKRTNGAVQNHPKTGKRILQFVSVRRRDNNEWAFPGGMVDPGEVVSQTLKREFLEETMNSLEMDSTTKASAESELEDFFSRGKDVYKGYVDDPRNTDNSWIETVAQNFHDEDGRLVGTLNLKAGDDAVGVLWVDVTRELKLYASHSSMLEDVAQMLNAHW